MSRKIVRDRVHKASTVTSTYLDQRCDITTGCNNRIPPDWGGPLTPQPSIQGTEQRHVSSSEQLSRYNRHRLQRLHSQPSTAVEQVRPTCDASDMLHRILDGGHQFQDIVLRVQHAYSIHVGATSRHVPRVAHAVTLCLWCYSCSSCSTSTVAAVQALDSCRLINEL